MPGSERVTCPTCSTVIEIGERCPVERGAGRCMEVAGHEGWHWTQMGGPGITRWTGEYAAHGMCAGRMSLHDWCRWPVGHGGAHGTDYPRVAFHEVEVD